MLILQMDFTNHIHYYHTLYMRAFRFEDYVHESINDYDFISRYKHYPPWFMIEYLLYPLCSVHCHLVYLDLCLLYFHMNLWFIEFGNK